MNIFLKWCYRNCNIKPKPFHIALSPGHGFKVGDVISTDLFRKNLIVIDSDVKDKKWKKFLRNLGMSRFLLKFNINVYDYTGCIKVKQLIKHQ